MNYRGRIFRKYLIENDKSVIDYFCKEIGNNYQFKGKLYITREMQLQDHVKKGFINVCDICKEILPYIKVLKNKIKPYIHNINWDVRINSQKYYGGDDIVGITGLYKSNRQREKIKRRNRYMFSFLKEMLKYNSIIS